MTPRFLYLHGFGSTAHSKKGVATTEHFAARGVTIERLDLRVPSFERLRLSAMIETTIAAIGGDRDRAVLLGSSLGALTAARVAERDPRVSGLVLLAPAFRLLDRWREQLGDAWSAWERTGWRDVHDYATGQLARIDFGFARDVAAVDVGFPDARVPTVIVHGTRDEAVPVEHSRAFAAGQRHVRLVEVDDIHELVGSLPRILAEMDRFLAPWIGEAM